MLIELSLLECRYIRDALPKKPCILHPTILELPGKFGAIVAAVQAREGEKYIFDKPLPIPPNQDTGGKK